MENGRINHKLYKKTLVRRTSIRREDAVQRIAQQMSIIRGWWQLPKVIKVWKLLFCHITKMKIDHVERKVPKYENHKLRERKVKTLTRNSRDQKRDRHT